MEFVILPHADIVIAVRKDPSSKTVEIVIYVHALVNVAIFPHLSANAVFCGGAFFVETGIGPIANDNLFKLNVFGVDGLDE